MSAISQAVVGVGTGSQRRADRAQPEAALHHSLEAQLKVYVSGKQERTLQ